MKGIQPIAIKANLQQYTSPSTSPHISPNIDSQITAIPSVLAPFSDYTSLANTDVKIPGALSLSSNHPMCFFISDEYRVLLIFRVIFSPIIPNLMLHAGEKKIS